MLAIFFLFSIHKIDFIGLYYFHYHHYYLYYYYSRNNSATQADYIKPPKIAQVGPPLPNSQPPPPSAFKPVPPPKPKNYRPPMQGGAQNGNQWENGVSCCQVAQGWLLKFKFEC